MSEQSYLLFVVRIKEAYPMLSRSEKIVADYAMEHPETIQDLTMREFADRIHVSTATIVRFCRSCGFSGLSELKLSLKREYLALGTQRHSSAGKDVNQGDSVSLVKQKVMGYHNLVINNMLSNWNEDAYEDAVEAMTQANRIIICGEGGSRSSAFCLYHILINLGLNCETYMDSVFEIMNVNTLKANDVLIGITYTGRLRETIDSMRLAKQRGAITIGLIGFLHSPALEYVDILLNTTKITKNYYDSALSIRVSELAVIEILSTLLSVKLDRALEPITSREHVVSIRRVYGKDEQDDRD